MATLQRSALLLLAVVSTVVSADTGAKEAKQKQIESLLRTQAMLKERLQILEQQQPEERQLVGGATKGGAARRGAPRRLTPATAQDFTDALDFMWLIICGAMVMFMHAGFAVLEAGSVRSKNAGMVLLKNIMTVCIGTFAWYFFGYGIAYGVEDSEDPSEFVGSKYMFAADMVTADAEGAMTGTHHPKEWFFQWAFCATSSTIVSGCVAERIHLPAYMLFTFVMTAVIYPFVVYWTWSGAGFLTEEGYSDFAGSGIVHLTGGIAGLVGAICCGARADRWESPEQFYPHNMGLVVLGCFILWFGFYGFNCGSTLTFSSSSDAMLGGLVAMNTTMSGAAGGLIVFLLRLVEALVKKEEQLFDVAGTCNGILAGLVSVCAGAGAFEPGMACLTGMCGGIFYEIGHWVLLKAKVDDPLDAFSVHGMGGIAGLLLRPLLCMGGADGDMFKAHIYGMLTIIAWSGGLATAIFLPLRLLGILSYKPEDQKVGSDVHCSPPKMYSQD